MNRKNKVSLLLFIAIIVLFESLQYLFRVKLINKELLENIELYNTYKLEQMILYVIYIIPFILIAIYTNFSKTVNIIMFKGIFSILIIGDILFKLFIYKDNSVFYILSLVFQIGLLIYLIIFDNRKGQL